MGTREFVIDALPYLPISSPTLKVTGTSYVDRNNYSNIEINDITYEGRPLDLATGTYSNGRSNAGYTYSNNGTVSFPGSLFTPTSTYLADTRDDIDGDGGINTVIYRGPYSNYLITQQTNGALMVKSLATAEGPDTLNNIQKLIFSDKQIDLPQSK